MPCMESTLRSVTLTSASTSASGPALTTAKTADELADRKAQHITTAGPDVVATGNIGCMLQIAAALERIGQKTPVLHTIQIIDASINEATRSQLFR